MSTIIIEELKPMVRGALRGFCRVRLPSGMIIHDLGLYEKDGKAWVSPSGRPALGRDGTQIRGRDGKMLFNPTITFADRETADRFTEAVLAALRASHPAVFA